MRTSFVVVAAGLVAGLVMSWSIEAAAQVRVQGYTRKDGTYVQPHYRSAPDSTPTNNYSYPGNTNPYTGKIAPGNGSYAGDGLPSLELPSLEPRLRW